MVGFYTTVLQSSQHPHIISTRFFYSEYSITSEIKTIYFHGMCFNSHNKTHLKTRSNHNPTRLRDIRNKPFK